MTKRNKTLLYILLVIFILLIINYFLPLRSVYQELNMMSNNPYHLKNYSGAYSILPHQRIALCISGQFRYTEKILDNHQTILSLRPDVFIYSEGDLDTKSRNQIIQNYQPKKCVWDNSVVEPMNRLSINNVKMFKRIYQCDLLRQEYEKSNGFEYDVVIRMRPDTVFYDPFPMHVIQKPLLNQRIYFPMRTNKEALLYGLPDMMFFGTSKDMSIMCQCYLHLEELKKIDICSNEYIFMNYMVMTKLIGRRIKFKINNFDRTFHMGLKVVDKYIKGKMNYIKNGLECYSNNEYNKVVIEDELG